MIGPRNIGVTGSRKGLTPAQETTGNYILTAVLQPWEEESPWFHHGDCIGVDEQMYQIAFKLGYRIAAHPPCSPAFRAFVCGDQVRPSRPYLERNHQIVNEVDTLLAFPDDRFERLHSGTWATIRYARRIGRNLVIVWPDGTVEVED